MTPRKAQEQIFSFPSDWRVVRLGDVVTFLKNGVNSRAELTHSEGVRYLHYGDVHACSGVSICPASLPSIPVHKVKRLDRLEDGDLVFADASEDIAGVSKSVEIRGADDFEVVSGLHTIAARFDKDVLADGFKGYLQFNHSFATHLRRLAAGTKVLATNRAHIASAELSLPPISEQCAIAKALSDVDALLGGLDRLIAKKRDLKQAAMQQLLTGHTRLPGFQGAWETKLLPDLADIKSGGTPSTNDPSAWGGDIPWCTPTDITALAGRKYLADTSRRITEHGLKKSSAEIIPAGSIVMTSRATIGECAINTVPVTTNQGFKTFVPFECVDNEFLYYLLTTQKAGFISLCGGSTFLEIGKAQLRSYGVRVPADKAEQKAIANVLSEMDAEVAALEDRRDKTRALKQGMMQELLTGRTRLV